MSEQTQFSSLGLSLPITKALQDMGFTTPTPIQAQSIPHSLQGRDMISIAETGSGKTAAYLIPTIERQVSAKDDNKKIILILTPTRELAQQVLDVAKKLTQFIPGYNLALLIGGDHMGRQMMQLKKRPRLIVATPGRLMDHHRRRTVNLSTLSALIIDEADRMFDMGFAPQVDEIVQSVPAERQTMLFSATFPAEVKTLANKILKDPLNISVEKSSQTPSLITQKIIPISAEKKEDTTLDLVNAAKGSVLIFARTKQRTDSLAAYLESYGVKVARIHGDRSQGQRNQALRGFRSGFFRVLVATDIAARGIDVSSVSDVINFDIPETYEDYIHRIGRTGRAGREGQASTLVTNNDRHRWTYMARKLGIETPRPERSSSSRSEGFGRSGGFSRSGGFDRSTGSSRPVRFDRAATLDRAASFDRPARSDRNAGPARFGKPDGFKRTDRPFASDRDEASDRSQRPSRFDKGDRGDRFEREQQAERPRRSGAPSRFGSSSRPGGFGSGRPAGSSEGSPSTGRRYRAGAESKGAATSDRPSRKGDFPPKKRGGAPKERSFRV